MGKIIDYLEKYNKLWKIKDHLSSKDRKKLQKLHEWALNEDRRKQLYGINDITICEF